MEVTFEYDHRRFRILAHDGDYIGAQIERQNTFYELDLLEFIRSAGPYSGIAIDAGANIGNHTLFMAAVLGVEVVAAEPVLSNFELLSKNVSANELSGNVRLLNAALGESAGRVGLVQGIEGNSGTFAISDDAQPGVDIVTLDSILDGDEKVEILKVDVEGHEIPVLKGAEDMLRRDRPLVAIECHSAQAFADINAHLSAFGYEAIELAGRSDNFLWACPGVLGEARFRNLKDGTALLQLRRQFRRVLEATDRIGRAVASVAKQQAQDIDSVRLLSEKMDGMGAASSDIIASLGVRSEEVGSRLGALEHQVSEFLRSSDSLLEAKLRPLGESIGRHLDQRFEALLSRIDNTARLLESAANERSASLGAVLESVSERLGTLITDAAAASSASLQNMSLDLSRRLSELEISTAESTTRRVEREVAMSQERARAGVAELKIEQLTKRLREMKMKDAQAEREINSRDAQLAELRNQAAHWESSYSLLYGSRPLRFSRAIRKLLRRSWGDHDPSARKRLIQAWSRVDQAPRVPKRPSRPVVEVRGRHSGGREAVRAGLATMPGREEGLKVVVASISPQVDELFVYLNGFDNVPEWLLRYENIRAILGPDVGDRGKFISVDGYRGYFISVDDDIRYPRFYVRHLIDGIERYQRMAVVGWHGSVIKEPFEDYYSSSSRWVLSFRSERQHDTPVHVLGTGCAAFHTDSLRIQYADFEFPNMADVYLALAGQRQQVPFVVLSHRKGWADAIEFADSPSISGESMRSSSSRIDVRDKTNALVKGHGAWQLHRAEASMARRPLKLAIIGRTNVERWKKGGILKSCHLTKEMLDPYGVQTQLVDLESGDVEGLNGFAPEIVMIYPGDPKRPDYKRVEYLVDYHAGKGRVVIVNLSLNAMPERSAFARERMRSWRERHGNKVWLMGFANRVSRLPEFGDISDAILVLPKTLEMPEVRVQSFSSTSGIFLGDYGKLCDARLLGFDALEVISALRNAIPEARLFTVNQYRPARDPGLPIEILPYLSDDYDEILRRSRLMVSLVKFATFEMVPAELAGMGVPVLHPPMDVSLSDYLGLSAFECNSVNELVEAAETLYRDPMAWNAASASCELRAKASDFRNLSAQMYLRLRSVAKFHSDRG